MEGNIYQRLAQINAKVGAITKSQTNTTQKFMYRGIDDVMNELHSLFAEHEVIIIPELLEFQVKDRVGTKGNALYYTWAKMKFSFVTTDGSSVSTVNVGEAMDSGDKGTNKAMSIALKYTLMQMFLIPTEEKKDPDADAYDVQSQYAQQIANCNSAVELNNFMAQIYNYDRALYGKLQPVAQQRMQQLQ